MSIDTVAAAERCNPAGRLCVMCLRICLDRKPPPRPDERDWEDFELLRVVVTGHTRMVTTAECAPPESGSVALDGSPQTTAEAPSRQPDAAHG